MNYDIINKILSRMKDSDFKLDENLPFRYLLGVMVEKVFSLVYGTIRLCSLKKVMVHPTVVIKCRSKFYFGRNLNIERGCYIDALSKNGLVLGDNVSMGINTCVRLSGTIRHVANGVKIGNNVGLGTHGYYGCGVGFLEIGDNTIFGNYVSIHPETHNFTDSQIPIREQGVCSRGGVVIGSNCWIGAKVTILDGTKIGNNCIVAAGAVVRGEFPDNVMIAGVPAKIIKNIY